ncbi:MAG: cytochrome C [Nitrospinota bacterium]
MLHIVKIVTFSLIVMLGFVGFTKYAIPLVVPEPPPVEEKLSGDITIEQFIAFGNKIFHGKGTCTLCHNPVGGRAPVLEAAGKDGPPVGVRAADRIKDPRYKAKATNGEEYLRESMHDPSAFVVAGFGKKGSNDTLSPMPVINKGAIGLSEVEIDAVIAFLQSVSGVDVTVSLPSGEVSAGEEEEPQEIQVAANAKEALAKFECATCHTHPLIEEGGEVGPDLTHIGARAGKSKKGMSAEQYIKESILNPNAFIADKENFEPDMMPPDFAKRMTVAEFHMMVDALVASK